jgi:hypothetical protein
MSISFNYFLRKSQLHEMLLLSGCSVSISSFCPKLSPQYKIFYKPLTSQWLTFKAQHHKMKPLWVDVRDCEQATALIWTLNHSNGSESVICEAREIKIPHSLHFPFIVTCTRQVIQQYANNLITYEHTPLVVQCKLDIGLTLSILHSHFCLPVRSQQYCELL